MLDDASMQTSSPYSRSNHFLSTPDEFPKRWKLSRRLSVEIGDVFVLKFMNKKVFAFIKLILLFVAAAQQKPTVEK